MGPKHLRTADAEKAKAEAANEVDGGAVGWPPGIQRLRQLPVSTMSFQAASRGRALKPDAALLRFFALLSPHDSEGRMVFSNNLGHTTLYDADTNFVNAMPVLADELGCPPITISVASSHELQTDLYVMHPGAGTHSESCFFGVLSFARGLWCWDPLPSPPLGRCTRICSHAVADGGHAICVSARSWPGYGPSPTTDDTYCFDTVKREWKRVGDWILPFEGEAAHVPALGNLWLGFADDDRNLCAVSGLSAAMETAPALLHVWRDPGKVPGNCWQMPPKLLDLGGGMFCIAKTCNVFPDTDYDEYFGLGIEVIVLSSVELLIRGTDKPPGSIDIVEHKSLGYVCLSDLILWML